MIARVADNTTAREKQVFGIAVAVIAGVAWTYWPSFARMMGMWSLSDYQYGWLVYPIALYLLWSKRAELGKVPMQASWSGVGVVAALVLLWLVARAAGVQVVEFAAVSLLPAAAFWAVAGARALRVVVFPFGILLAGVPVGEFLVQYLQEITATISSTLLALAGVPAYRENNFLTLPGGSFEVAEACGGLRYVLAACMASLAFAYTAYSAVWKRVLFVALAGLAMVVTNGFRAFIVMAVASGTEMRLLAGRDHIYFGMILFAVAFAVMVRLGARYADDRRAVAGEIRGPLFAASRGTSVPVLATTLLCLGMGPILVRAQAHQPDALIVSAELPELPGCSGPGEWARNWSPEFAAADRIERAGYRCTGHDAAVYFATYATQAQGKELASSANRVWPHGWRRYVQESVTALHTEVGTIDVREVFVAAPDRSMLMWYWYQVGESTFATDFGSKAATVTAALTFNPVPASVIAVEVEVPHEAEPNVLRSALRPKTEALLAWYRTAARELRP